jgi:hypothetical protein
MPATGLPWRDAHQSQGVCAVPGILRETPAPARTGWHAAAASGRALSQRPSGNAPGGELLAGGLGERRDECWFLMTDLAFSVRKLADLYGRRMTSRERFRGEENPGWGWASRQTQIRRAERFDRLLAGPDADSRRVWDGWYSAAMRPGCGAAGARQDPAVRSASAETCFADLN